MNRRAAAFCVKNVDSGREVEYHPLRMRVFPAILLSLLTLCVTGSSVNGATSVRGCDCAVAVSVTGKQLRYVLAVHSVLSELYSSRLHSSAGTHAENIRAATAAIRPHIERLKQLPPPQLQELCLLADGILWQSDWLYGMYLGEFGVLCEAAPPMGMEMLVCLSGVVTERLKSTKTTAEEKAAWSEMLDLFGGESALSLPHRLLDARPAKDYKTALNFFKDFCAAASEKDEKRSEQLLREQAAALNYLLQGGEPARLRVSYLLNAFCDAVQSLQRHNQMPTPILPDSLRSSTRMQTLEPFFLRLPQLRRLILH